ncbi:hypothetical protein Bpfe_001032 [Biomphalaria pfeifferi]|uniref:Chitin-binding type-2 domain-containing protein n=1 Tax=Biomphalaria pfeifferi TaxID=112525 RepID=A0AAD8CD58_BIOPF|nr:hypothetical protein Bpfe_001032 [Biomphalaria pfeifferi]
MGFIYFIHPILIAITIISISCRVQGQDECFHGDLRPFDTINCSRTYELCEHGKWAKAMCVGTVFNTTNLRCVPYSHTCPENGFLEKTFSGRTKRATDDCSRSFTCPKTITNMFIYPDWSNTACDSYVVCFREQTLVGSCKSDGYNYYNPRRLSCENIDSMSNTCLHRLSTDLSPLF